MYICFFSQSIFELKENFVMKTKVKFNESSFIVSAANFWAAEIDSSKGTWEMSYQAVIRSLSA